MSSLKICRICLRTEAKGYKFEHCQLKYFYEEVTAIKVEDSDEMPQWFCYECATMLHKFHKFKEKCYIAQKCFKEILWKGPITYEAIYKSEQAAQLQSTLKSIIVTDKVKTFVVKEYEPESDNETCDIHRSYETYTHKNSDVNYLSNSKQSINIENTHNSNTKPVPNIDDFELRNSDNLDTKNIYILHAEKREKASKLRTENYVNLITDVKNSDTEANNSDIVNSNLDIDVKNSESDINNMDTDDNNLNTEFLVKTDSDSEPNKTLNNEDQIVDCKNFSKELNSPISILVQENKVVNIKSEKLKTFKNKKFEIGNLKEVGKYLSEDNWKKVVLTEEEAVKEFREKAEDPKYLDAVYKCSDCFKGFSKKEMLNRHVLLRHSEELGGNECRLCRMRFKWKCHLRKHTQQHYLKFECLRCHVVFNLEASALLHEEYHTGVGKKCRHCGEEFRHITTYYTHMRTHRSAHVCVHCGASFVSKAGLNQHTRRKHRDQFESYSSGSDDDRENYCARCDIRFHSRRAHTEHLFHSDMHTEVVKEKQDEVESTKKIMGKRLREKITKELRKRRADLDNLDISLPVKAKRKRRVKKKYRKPSTCHQCGLQFSTQAACMKHHVAAHPRTSFYSPTARHICELCGASLAPGSVAVHQNMHSREKVHTCETCGRQFHSGVGLKRHLVTHTGEKPFACSLCEKRFTQSNSMKLHYKTFHLKQPYPKRIRKKKKDEPNRLPVHDTEDESDSVQETVPEAPPEPDMPPQPEVSPAPGLPTILHGVGENGGSLDCENMHYLTLS